jgi:hypothetical protein
MSNKIIVGFVLLGLIAIPSFSQTTFKYDTVMQVNKNLPNYGFIINETKNEYNQRSYLINIYRTDSNSLLQTIDLSKYDYWYGFYDAPYIDTLIDVNFDGYCDLPIVVGIGQNGKNWDYQIFFFNKSDGNFYKKKNFPGINNISIDESSKQIHESFWTGCLDCIVWNTYIIENDELILVEKDYQEIDDKTHELRRFVERYKNGKLVSKEELKPVLD